MNTNKEIIEAIIAVKTELNWLRYIKAPKAQQLDAFKRLVTLYGTLNMQALANENNVA